MMSTICNGTKLDLSRLTDEEVKHVWQVIQRDFNLRKTEKDRLSYLKSKIVKEDTKRELLGYQPNFSDSFCISCLQPFKFLLSAKHQCMECKQFVCKSCSCFHKKEQGWVCDPCQMSRVLQIGTLEWFHENLHARFKHFGSAKVMMSIFKRLNAEWNCSQTNLRDGPMCSQEDDQSEGLGCEYYRMSRKSKRLLPVDPQDFNIGTEYSIYFQCHSLKNERPDPEVDWTTDFRHIPDHGKYGIGEGKKGIFHISNRRLVIPSDSDDFKNSDNMMVRTHSLSKISHSLSGSANYLEYCELPYSIEDSEEDDVESSQNFMYPGPVSRKCSSDEVAPQITELNKRMSVIETLLGRLEGKMTDEEKSHPSHQVKPAEELLSPVDLEEWELKRRLEELTENISEKGLSSDEDESNKLTEDIKALRIIMRRKSATLDKNSFSCQLQKSNFYKDEPFSTQRILNSYEVNATAGELSQLESKVALTVARVQSTQSDVTDIQNRIAAFNVIRKTTDHWKKKQLTSDRRMSHELPSRSRQVAWPLRRLSII